MTAIGPVKRRPGRPRKVEASAKVRATARGESMDVGDSLSVSRGVSITWLEQVFGIHRRTVQKRLIDGKVHPCGEGHGGHALYDLKEAMACFVEPKFDVEQYLAKLNPKKLPPELSKVFWDAKRSKLRYQLEAGQAWPTEDVLDVFGEVFMLIRSQTKHWMTELLARGDMSDAQFKRLQRMVDKFQDSLHKKLCELPKNRKTKSVAGQDEEADSAAPEEVDLDLEDFL